MPHQNLHILDHPLIQHKLTLMRRKETETGSFRKLLHEISFLMGYEVTRTFATKQVEIESPLEAMQAAEIADPEIVVVPILRSGLGMTAGLLELLPKAKVGHIGLYRHPVTKRPVEYLVKLPEANYHTHIIVDPMLATGQTACYAVETLVKSGVDLQNIHFVALLASPQGVETFCTQYPGIPLYLAALDRDLNQDAYVVPGIGDVGDRLFGTL